MTQYFLLNTNLARHPQDHRFMLDNHVAAAFEDGYKEKITRISQGDYIFLYASKCGIVAYGRADGNVQQTDHLGIPNQTFYQKLAPLFHPRTHPLARQRNQSRARAFHRLRANPHPSCRWRKTTGASTN